MKIDAVLFDAAHTLLRVEPSVGHVYAATAARYGVHVEPEQVERLFREAWKERVAQAPNDLFSSEARERAWWGEVVTEVFTNAGAMDAFAGRFDDFFDALFDLFAHPEPWRVYDDVVPALVALQAREVPMAVVSNWDSRLPLLMDRLDLGRYFRFILTSAEAGYRKPHPRIFEIAMERLNVPSHRAIYVGDSYEEDVVGARGAGLRALFLDREGKAQERRKRIPSLREVLGRVES